LSIFFNSGTWSGVNFDKFWITSFGKARKWYRAFTKHKKKDKFIKPFPAAKTQAVISDYGYEDKSGFPFRMSLSRANHPKLASLYICSLLV
jgi:hypothetical protein